MSTKRILFGLYGEGRGMDSQVCRVWVTEIGAVTPLGADAASTWAGLLAGRSGVRALEDKWAADLPVRIAAALTGTGLTGTGLTGTGLTEGPAALLPRPQARKLDRGEQLALLGAREAWRDAGAPEVEPERLAVVIGTGTGGLLTTLGQDDVFEESGARRLSPFTVPMLMP